MNHEFIMSEMREFCQKHGIKSGWTQAQHVGFQFHLLTEASTSQSDTLIILTETVNPSAFRQTAERAGILTKTEGTKAKTMANPYVTIAKE